MKNAELAAKAAKAAMDAVGVVVLENTREDCGPEIVGIVLDMYATAAAMLVCHGERSFARAGFPRRTAEMAFALRYADILRSLRAASAAKEAAAPAPAPAGDATT